MVSNSHAVHPSYQYSDRFVPHTRDGESRGEAECIVRSRIGFLVGNVDKWWEISDPLEVDEMVKIVPDTATNFFDRHQSLGDVAASLEKSKVVDDPYPLPAIYLALIVRELGQTVRSNDILRQLEAKTLGGWRSRITELLTAE